MRRHTTSRSSLRLAATLAIATACALATHSFAGNCEPDTNAAYRDSHDSQILVIATDSHADAQWQRAAEKLAPSCDRIFLDISQLRDASELRSILTRLGADRNTLLCASPNAYSKIESLASSRPTDFRPLLLPETAEDIEQLAHLFNQFMDTRIALAAFRAPSNRSI